MPTCVLPEDELLEQHSEGKNNTVVFVKRWARAVQVSMSEMGTNSGGCQFWSLYAKREIEIAGENLKGKHKYYPDSRKQSL